MSLKNSLVALVVVLVTTSTTLTQEHSSTGCALIDVTRPPLFMLYEGRLELEIRLRLRNNCSCAIVVETDDRYPTQLNKLPGGVARIKSVLDHPQDGVRLPLHYLIQNKTHGDTRRAYGWGDSVFIYEIPAGQSITFTVPTSHFKRRSNIAVPFNYSWERKSFIGMGAGGIVHLVYFLFQDLPSAALDPGNTDR